MRRKSSVGYNKPEFEIVPMSARHVQEITAIELMSFSDPWSVAMLDAELSASMGKSYVAEINRQVAGYLNARVILDECNIVNLAVHPSHKRKGIATALFTEIRNYAKSLWADILNLEVRESNAAAREFYKKMGMKETGRRLQYYVSPVEDAILMGMFLGG